MRRMIGVLLVVLACWLAFEFNWKIGAAIVLYDLGCYFYEKRSMHREAPHAD